MRFIHLVPLGYGNMAEWSKAPESGYLWMVYLVRKGEGSNPSVVMLALYTYFLLQRYLAFHPQNLWQQLSIIIDPGFYPVFQHK